MQWPIGYAREQRAKRDRSAFAALIGTPSSGPFTLPANARIVVRSVAGCVAGTTAATFNDRTIKTPALMAGACVTVGQVERGVELAPASGFEVLIDMGLGRIAKVGEGA
jgi:hypothetical protein